MEIEKNRNKLNKMCKLAYESQIDGYGDGLCLLNTINGELVGLCYTPYMKINPHNCCIPLVFKRESDDSELEEFQENISNIFDTEMIMELNRENIKDIGEVLEIEDYWNKYVFKTFKVFIYDEENPEEINIATHEYNDTIKAYIEKDGILINTMQYYDKFHDIPEVFNHIDFTEVTNDLKITEIKPISYNRGLDEKEIQGDIIRLR
jgi:hypothetical protein